MDNQTKSKSALTLIKRLDWMMDRQLTDMNVTVGCKTCNEVHVFMAGTARTSWLAPKHMSHEVWMKNPFKK